MNNEALVNTALNTAGAQAGGLWTWATEHPVLAILAVVAALVVLLIVLRLAVKIFVGVRNQKQVASLKKDLMIWSVLSSLVHGGSKTDKAKAEINSRLYDIDASFEHMGGIIKSQKHMTAERPWFVALGEPSCGKSALIENSSLDFKCSESENETKKPAVKFHYNSQSIVVDVSGKVFFDNWMGGSSAEWNHICTLLRKKHHKKPLNGIILTISAESLLADDRKLTQKKVSLISSELLRLTGTLRMHLPLYVVVTKLDAVLGFREYFQNLDDSAKDQIMGFQPLTDEGGFSENDFNAFYDALLLRLRDGAVGLMGGKEALELTYQNRSRMEVNGKIYLFPENFGKLRDNLFYYLQSLFSTRDRDGELTALFKGVYFTSAEDQGYCLNERFAAFNNKSIDDAPFADGQFKHSRSYFIQELMQRLILPSGRDATFTKGEQLQRRIPVLAACAALVTLSGIYWYAALFSAPKLEARLTEDQLYYEALTRQFDAGQIDDAPLLGVDYQGNGVMMLNNSMPGDRRITRINFYSDAQDRIMKRISIPWTFFPASVLKFGLGSDTAIADRTFLYDQIQTKMSFLPMVDSVEHSFIERKGEPLTLEKRAALFEFMGASSFSDLHKTPLSNDVYDSSMVRALLEYLYPQSNEAIRRQLAAYYPDYDYLAQSTNNAVVLSEDYAAACQIGIEDLVENWQKLANYPSHEYSVLRRDVTATRELIGIYDQLDALSSLNVLITTPDQLERINERYQDLVKQYLSLLDNVDEMTRFAAMQQSSEILKGSKKKAAEGEENNSGITGRYYAAFESAYQNYRKLLDEDFTVLSSFERGRTKEGATREFGSLDLSDVLTRKSAISSRLESDHESLKQTIVDVQQEPLFAQVDAQDPKSEFNYRVLGEVLETSRAALPSLEINSPDAIAVYSSKIDAELKHSESQLEELAEHYRESPEITRWVKFAANFLEVQRTIAHIQEVRQILALYPDTANDMNLLSDLTMLVADYKGSVDIGRDMSFDMAREILGGFEVRQEYQPDGFIAYSSPIAHLAAHALDTKHPYFKKVLANSEKFQRLSRVFKKYCGSYFNYWGHFADSLHPKAASYAEFYELATGARAYQINSQLQDLYDLSYAAVDKVENNLLDDNGKSLKDATLKHLDARAKSVDINFTDSCNAALTAWSLLSPDATYANRMVMNMTDKELRASLKSFDKKSLPWWREFASLGTKLLKRDASSEASTSLAMYQGELKFFPLVKDGDPHAKILSKSDIRALMAMFKTFGLSGKGKGDVPEALAGMQLDDAEITQDGDLRAPLVFSEDASTQSEFKIWAGTMEKLMTLLASADRNTYFRLSRVGAATQNRLMREQGFGGYESAITKYRFFSITSGGSTGQRLSSYVNLEEPQAIARGVLDNTPVTFNFYRYSDSDKPDCTYTVDGGYPGLQLYLDENAVYDDESGITYVPLVLKDPDGSSSVFYIAFSSAVKLPSANDWPSLANWPGLSLFRESNR